MGWEWHRSVLVLLLAASQSIPAAQFRPDAALLFVTASFPCRLQHIKEEYASPDSPVAVFGGWRRHRMCGTSCSPPAVVVSLEDMLTVCANAPCMLMLASLWLPQVLPTVQCWPPG